MPCPFGYTAEDEDEELEAELLGEDGKAGPNKSSGTAGTEGKIKAHTRTSGNGKTPPKDEKDPISWFYSNQIKSEQEFQAKKDALKAEARKRLDEIMDKKQQRLLWPSDSEFDNVSLSSGELSELDSDVHSLASIRSCAYSWIASSSYRAPAEITTKLLSSATLALSVYALYDSYKVMTQLQEVQGVLRNGQWAAYCLLLALALAGGSSFSLLAANWRSRRLLLTAQICIMAVYGLFAVMATLLWVLPVEVDPRMQHAMCGGGWSTESSVHKSVQSKPMCDKLPKVQAFAQGSMANLKWTCMLQATACLALTCVGIWYTFELCFIEKKGAKHTRRHRRRRFTIPWDKIKIEGKPLPCGGGGGGAFGGKAAGRCPVMPKDKNA